VPIFTARCYAERRYANVGYRICPGASARGEQGDQAPTLENTHSENFSRGLKTFWLFLNKSIVVSNLCTWYSGTSMLLTHHNDTL